MRLDLLIISISPSIAFLIWIYLKDKYEKEPIRYLINLFILGTLVSIPAIAIEDILMKVDISNKYLNIAYIAFIVAAFTEEILKASILIAYCLKSKYYTEKLDGIVYSIFITLGFATIENIIYIFYEVYLNIFEIGLTRAIISIPAHIMFAITMGYYLSMYKFNQEENRYKYILKMILIPIFLHGVFDFILMIKTRGATVVFIIYLVYLWKISLDKLDQYTDYARKRFIRLRKRKK
ncbi:PrsW family intramembrane metalloprotease [Paraclostridium bifermentans]|uniref:PrsW family intramembrane metalloprotease n=1 Tax=Paraclostridium bifermentans TaxID=1490 RepID=UPI00359C77C3